MTGAVGPTPDDVTATPFFEWITELAAHLELRQKSDPTWRVALLVGRTCRGNTGEDVRLDEKGVTTLLGMSRSTFYVHRDRLVAEGWLVQTELPTRPPRGAPRGSKGRAARYRLALPDRVRASRAKPGHDDALIVSEVDAQGPDTMRPDRVRKQARSCPETGPIVSEHHARSSDASSYKHLPHSVPPPARGSAGPSPRQGPEPPLEPEPPLPDPLDDEHPPDPPDNAHNARALYDAARALMRQQQREKNTP